MFSFTLINFVDVHYYGKVSSLETKAEVLQLEQNLANFLEVLYDFITRTLSIPFTNLVDNKTELA